MLLKQLKTRVLKLENQLDCQNDEPDGTNSTLDATSHLNYINFYSKLGNLVETRGIGVRVSKEFIEVTHFKPFIR